MDVCDAGRLVQHENAMSPGPAAIPLAAPPNTKRPLSFTANHTPQRPAAPNPREACH